MDLESHEAHGAAYFTADFWRILNDDEIDVVSICSPDSTHYKYAIEGLKAERHALVEKPMATTIEQCREITSAVETSRGIFGVHHQMRYVPSFPRLLTHVEANTR